MLDKSGFSYLSGWVGARVEGVVDNCDLCHGLGFGLGTDEEEFRFSR